MTHQILTNAPKIRMLSLFTLIGYIINLYPAVFYGMVTPYPLCSQSIDCSQTDLEQGMASIVLFSSIKGL